MKRARLSGPIDDRLIENLAQKDKHDTRGHDAFPNRLDSLRWSKLLTCVMDFLSMSSVATFYSTNRAHSQYLLDVWSPRKRELCFVRGDAPDRDAKPETSRMLRVYALLLKKMKKLQCIRLSQMPCHNWWLLRLIEEANLRCASSLTQLSNPLRLKRSLYHLPLFPKLEGINLHNWSANTGANLPGVVSDLLSSSKAIRHVSCRGVWLNRLPPSISALTLCIPSNGGFPSSVARWLDFSSPVGDYVGDTAFVGRNTHLRRLEIDTNRSDSHVCFVTLNRSFEKFLVLSALKLRSRLPLLALTRHAVRLLKKPTDGTLVMSPNVQNIDICQWPWLSIWSNARRLRFDCRGPKKTVHFTRSLTHLSCLHGKTFPEFVFCASASGSGPGLGGPDLSGPGLSGPGPESTADEVSISDLSLFHFVRAAQKSAILHANVKGNEEQTPLMDPLALPFPLPPCRHLQRLQITESFPITIEDVNKWIHTHLSHVLPANPSQVNIQINILPRIATAGF